MMEGKNIYEIHKLIKQEYGAIGLKWIRSDYNTILNRWKIAQVDNVDKFVSIELERLNKMLDGIWQKAENGDLYAIDRVLAINKRISEIVVELRRVKEFSQDREVKISWEETDKE